MKTSTIAAFAAGVITTGSIATLVAAGPKDKKDDHHHTDAHTHTDAPDPMEMSTEEMMAAWMELGTPGEKHKTMLKDVGTWTAHTKFLMDPSTPDVWTEGEGKCVIEPMLDGRFIKSTFTMDFMGMPFKGVALNGYDNGRECYVSTWVDSMSTQILTMTGHMQDDGSLVMEGRSFMPGMGEYDMKIVYTWDSEDQWTETFYDKMPGMGYVNTGIITFTRE